MFRNDILPKSNENIFNEQDDDCLLLPSHQSDRMTQK